jgi:hypothetical protein
MPDRPTVTTEQTSKKWKKLKAIGCAPMALAVLIVMIFGVSDQTPWRIAFVIAMLLAGLGIWITSAIGAWWDNG